KLLVGEVERRVLAFDGIKTVYARIGEQPRGMAELTEDTIGVIQFEFADWRTRRPAHAIMDGIRAQTADIPGILVEVTAPRAGPARTTYTGADRGARSGAAAG